MNLIFDQCLSITLHVYVEITVFLLLLFVTFHYRCSYYCPIDRWNEIERHIHLCEQMTFKNLYVHIYLWRYVCAYRATQIEKQRCREMWKKRKESINKSIINFLIKNKNTRDNSYLGRKSMSIFFGTTHQIHMSVERMCNVSIWSVR